ncbi:bifunctional lysylphosphatidylglycerol flippase/synthetase MprF [Candidatus Binatia bacterium]|nr:bifunctional lysylphosphatidylglycerol flippase/synthetase MprF [Candidatus Binatia bacterium]
MGRKRIRGLAPLISLAALAIVAWLLNDQLSGHNYAAIRRSIAAIPSAKVFLAIVLTALSYAVVTGYDRLGLRYLGRATPYAQTALASFLGFVFSRNIGLALLGPSAPRLRLYAAWEVSPLEIARLIAFTSLTFWLGGIALLGTALLFSSAALVGIGISADVARLIGALLLLLPLGYLMLTVLRRSPLVVRGVEVAVPEPGIAAAQVGLAVLDWVIAASVLYVLLPGNVHLSPGAFVAVFVTAMVAGAASQIPGGLGVFECIVLGSLASRTTVPAALAALLVFRAVYYLLPLAVALLLLGGVEAAERRGSLLRLGNALGRWIPLVAPRLLAVSTFLGGVLLLATGALPARETRLGWLAAIVPLPAVELSHFLASLVGLGLVLLASALQNRLDAAWVLSVILLASGSALALLRGLHWEEASILLATLAALLPCRRLFYRRAQLLGDLFSPGWIAAVAAAVGGSIWLGMFAYRHVDYSHELWWEFALFSGAPRFLRATVGVVGLAIAFSLAHLLRPAQAVATAPDDTTRDTVRAIVAASPSAMANLALLGDKSFLLSDSAQAFVMYGASRGCWVAMGDPVGPIAERTELVWRFRELCDHYDVHPVFYEVSPTSLPLYLDVGLTPFKFGECARVPLAAWSLEGPRRKGTRYVLKRQERDGSTFEVVPPEGVAAITSELRRVSDSWLEKRNTREKGFSLGAFSDDYVRNFPVAIVRRDERIVAFTNLWCGAGREEIAPDLMRYAADAPPDSMEFLFAKVMLWAQAEGYLWFNLGMAPLAGLEGRALAPFWQRVGAFTYRHGEHFYNFQGVRSYKQQFDPQWEARYLVVPGGLVLPRVLASVGALVSGGLRGLVTR